MSNDRIGLRDRAAQCDGKHPYPTWELARIARTNMRKKRGRRARRVSIYRCPHCKAWHVGHAPRRRIWRRFKHAA